MAASPEQAQSLVQICLVAASGVLSSKLDAATEKVTNEACGGRNANVFGSNVILETWSNSARI